jgi:hypothetical protein
LPVVPICRKATGNRVWAPSEGIIEEVDHGEEEKS